MENMRGRQSPTGQDPLRCVDVTLFWRGEDPWTPHQQEDRYTFRCVGVRFGSTRWQLHLAQLDRALPGMSTSQRRALVGALREALAAATGLGVLQLSSDLILDAV